MLENMYIRCLKIIMLTFILIKYPKFHERKLNNNVSTIDLLLYF